MIDTHPTLQASGSQNGGGGFRFDADMAPGLLLTTGTADDPLLPLGQDSKRYRTIGNGVATPCAEWIGHRLMAYLQEHA
jgi:site-specific DNA-cytosine methylase